MCLGFGEIALRVYDAYGTFYEADRPWPPDREPNGDVPTDVVRQILEPGAALGLAEALSAHLRRLEEKGTIGDGEPLFDYGNRYRWAGREVGGMLLTDTWVEFEEHLLHRARYFDPVIESYLEGVLEEVNTALGGREHSIPVGTVVYRARIVDESSARRVIEHPEAELGPPPRGRRSGGRLNAPGTAAFYGAFDANTAIAELRPPVGGVVASAAFETIRSLRMLDLTTFHLGRVNLLLDDAEQRVNAADFLRQFHSIITRPALDEDGFAYIPTQVVAEYLSKRGPFDAIIYRSVQVGKNKRDARNIAIFDAEGIVEGVPPVRRVRDERGWGALETPEPAPSRLRYRKPSASLVRIRAAQFMASPMHDMGDYFLEAQDIVEGLEEER